MQFAVRSDVFHAVPGPRTEDGVPLEGLVFYVIAEFEDGTRLAHYQSFPNGRRYTHPDGFDGWQRDDGRGEGLAEALCARIAAAVAAGHKLEPARWIEIDPAYGSDAYLGLDKEQFFRNREIMDSHEAGEISERTAHELMMR